MNSSIRTDKWIQPGQFSVDVPANWEVRELGDAVEVVPESADAAIHVTTYVRRLAGEPKADEARSLLASFARKSALIPLKPAHCFDWENTWTCDAEFEGHVDPNVPRYWFLRSIVRQEQAFLGSLCLDDLSSPSYVDGKKILLSMVSNKG